MELLSSNILNSIFVIMSIGILWGGIQWAFIKRITNPRKKGRYKVILRNVVLIALIFLVVRVWVEGFNQLITLFGFMSAALTLTLKDNLLNLTGGFIIMWRGSFAEGDYVSIKDHKGIVRNFGLFYFVLEEVKSGSVAGKTYKKVKIPNSYVSSYPFSVLEINRFIQFNRHYTFSFASRVSKLSDFKDQLQEKLQTMIHAQEMAFKGAEKREYQKRLKAHTYFKPTCLLEIDQEKPKGITLTISGHCTLHNEAQLNQFIDTHVIEFSRDSEVQLAT